MNAITKLRNGTTTNSSPKFGPEIFSLLKEVQEFEGRKITIEYKTDFDEFLETVESISDKGDLTPIFDVRFSDIGPDTGFWIRGVDSDGNLMHVQAIRFDDLADKNLAQHWESDPALYCTQGLGIDVEKSEYDRASAAREISGSVCYHGELWVEKSYRRIRLGSKLANLAMLMALGRFDPDYLYCLIVPKVIRTGLSVRNGYLHMHPQGIRWNIPGNDDPYDEYLVWMTGSELTDLMSRPQEVC